MRLKLILLGLYVALAIYAWIDFMRLPTDGLANVGLMIVTLPVTLVGLVLSWAVGLSKFVLWPDGFGYYGNHAVYYWPSVLITAVLLYALASLVRARMPPKP